MEKYKLYNDQIELSFDPIKHTYKVDDQVVYGVTSIIGVLDKPALMYWAVNKCIEYLQDNFNINKDYDEISKNNLLEEAKKAHRTYSKDATNIGQMFHDWAEDYINKRIKGEGSVKKPKNPELLSTVNGFLKWEKENKVEWLSSERKVYSETLSYAGTLDAEAKVNGELSVIDFKTSKAIYDEYFMQTASYIKAREEESGDKYKNAWIIRVSKVGGDFEARATEKIDEHFQGFLGCLQVYTWKMNRKKEQL